jgi:hypothetical protein
VRERYVNQIQNEDIGDTIKYEKGKLGKGNDSEAARQVIG